MPSYTDAGDTPTRFDLLPGELAARVHSHVLESGDGLLDCWSYVTEGLWAQRQKELIFTLRREPWEGDDEFPRAPLKFLAQIYRLAQSGQRVDVGDFTQFGEAGLLGYNGLIYISPQPFSGIELSSPSLAAILVTEEELEAAKAFGFARLQARLGQASGHYPCPHWSDRSRAGLQMAGTLKESVLTQISRLTVRGMSVRIESDCIVASLGPAARERLHQQLAQVPPDMPIALLTELDAGADGCLVWEPGQSEAAAITPPGSRGSRLSGCFLALVPGQQLNAGQVFEDGLMMLLTNDGWSSVHEAIQTQQPLSIQTTTGLCLSLDWLEGSYMNPIDGSVHAAEGGWRTVEPEGDPPADEGASKVKQIVLLTPEHEVAARLSVEELSNYIERIKGAVRAYFAGLPAGAGQDLLIQFEVRGRGEVELKMASRPGVPAETLQELHDRLLALAAPDISHEAISFQVLFAIWNGSSN